MKLVLRSIGSIGAIIAMVGSLTLSTESVVVSRGDTLGGIAAANGVTVSQLIEWNSITNPDLILAGSTLIIESATNSQIKDTTPVSAFYLVELHDTLSIIARKFGVAMSVLIRLNSITNPDLIFEGQNLTIHAADQPAPTTESQAPSRSASYTIVAGETLSGIAAKFGVDMAELARTNAIARPDRIVSGRVLIIPSIAKSPTGPDADSVDSSPAEAAPVPEVPAAVAPTPVAPDPVLPDPPAPPPDPSAIGSASLSLIFEKWSAIYAVPRGLLEALAWKESNWRPEAVGPSGHLGIAQLSPATIEFVESNLLGQKRDPLDPSDGIQLAARYLRYLLDRTPTQRTALAAWAQGLHGVLNNGPSQAGTDFADSVLVIRDARA